MFYKCFSGFQNNNNKGEIKRWDIVHHRMSIRRRTWGKKKKRGRCLLILSLHTRQHITHLWGHSAGQSWPWQRQTHTERGLKVGGQRSFKHRPGLQRMSWGVCRRPLPPSKQVADTCTLRRRYTPIQPVQPINTSSDHAENFLIVKPLAVAAIQYKRMQDLDEKRKTTCAFAGMQKKLRRKWEHFPAQLDLSKDGLNSCFLFL